ncbi:MAG TPA: outer membrane protein assembly factor BamD [Candidatus Acidoferrum sp.]
MSALLLVDASQCSAQILHRKKKINKSTEASNTAEPDKQLYDKAINDVKHGKHEVGRLGLQTLINTYPDSEYLAKAKLAIADSYFKEGGTSNITQAIAGYKDFIVFFPFLPEAAYAQLQVAMANYNEMAKPDRDITHAKAAEEEFQTFLQKYPKDPLTPKAEQRLREVQEVLAEGQYRIAYYYYVKGDRRAAAGRLIPLTKRYPLYSKSDTALWMLGDLFEKSERKDIAGSYYGQIVRNYPLSKRADDAKGKLKAFGVPVPQPDPKAVQWMTAEQNAPRPHESIVHRGWGTFRGGPDVHAAAQNGSPNLEAETEVQGTDVFGGGNRSNIAAGSTGKTGLVATVKVGESAPAGSTTGGSAEDVNSTGQTEGSDSTAGASTTGSTATGQTGSTDSPATATTTTDGSNTSAPAADSTAGATAKPADANAPADSKKTKESSSKKKGLKKIIPW